VRSSLDDRLEPEVDGNVTDWDPNLVLELLDMYDELVDAAEELREVDTPKIAEARNQHAKRSARAFLDGSERAEQAGDDGADADSGESVEKSYARAVDYLEAYQGLNQRYPDALPRVEDVRVDERLARLEEKREASQWQWGG